MTFADYSEKSQSDDWSPGWDVIDAAFAEVYGEQEPSHFATRLEKRALFGGPEYLDGYSIYKSDKGYYHIVTYGMTQLYSRLESYGEDFNKWGYEMTFKLKANSVEECHWAMNMMGNLARYTFTSGSFFQENEYVLGDGSPLELESDSKMCSLLIVEDTEVVGRDSVHGQTDFLQLVGITWHDAQIINEHRTRGYVEEVLEKIKVDNPDFITDMKSERNYL
ncbi:suppressor of fused domain protein [Erysipelothrix sp. HDW6C]|nr:suppressor of fused domain protein [Erysipelothrix sp. HDW6C]